MKAYVPQLIFFSGMLFFLTCPTAWAGFQFNDPAIPHGERITYRSESEGQTTLMEETVVQLHEEGGMFYEVTSRSPALDTIIRIDRKDMTVFSVHTIQKYDTATLDSKLIIRDLQPNISDDAITVPHFVALTHLLRGYPFESKKKLQISYYGGSAKNKFTLCVRYKKRERININDTEIECYKLEFGLDGFLAAVLPELELWYTVKPPHYLVRYKGPEGPPGTPVRLIELVDYRLP